MHLKERKIKEIEHSDRRRTIVRAYEYHTDASPDQLEEKYVEGKDEFEQHFSNMKFYSITRTSFAYRDALLFGRIKGAVALDYCCGNGEVAVEMARQGASRVVGIDISSVAIENARKLAKEHGLEDICELRVMDAEDTKLLDNSFDVIHEYGALHHLDLPSALKELSRILKPEGLLICTEALRHNPFIHQYRKRTPHLRTKWEAEHILGIQEILGGLRYFENVSIHFFHLAALSAVPFRETRYFNTLLFILEKIDNAILRIPYLQRMAWIAVFVYRKPRKP
jgi:ubiquinone/menaquinone biosynthesis C-methylase UbiE